jgi:hypothetical protein
MSSIMKEPLNVSSNTNRRHASRNCSSMSSLMKELLMKELLIVSSIIIIIWHGSHNWDFDLIQLKGEQYVLAGVCWRPQEWILKVGLQSPKTINKSAQSMRSQEWTSRQPGEPQYCNQAAQECTAEQDTGVQWRSLCTMPITGVMAINDDPSFGNIWITGVYWRYL